MSYGLDQNYNEKARAEILEKKIVGILVQTMTQKGHFEINWPLSHPLGKEIRAQNRNRRGFEVKNMIN